MGRSTVRPVLLVISATALAGCASFRHPEDAWMGADKFKHFAVSAAIASGTYALADHNGADDGEAAGIAAGVTLTIGAGKEWYDAGTSAGDSSGKDLVWDLLGAAAGIGVAAAAR